MDLMIFLLSIVVAAVLIVALTHASVLLQYSAKRRCRSGGRKPYESRPTDQKIEALSTDFAALISAITKESEASRAEEQREDSAKQMREWLTIGLVAATLAVLGWQVSEMIKVYGPIKDQAIASQAGAKAAVAPAANSEKSLMEAQRAWVGPNNVGSASAPQGNKPLKITIDYSDSGRSPGLNFQESNDWRAIDTNLVADNNWAKTQINAWVTECRSKAKTTGGETVFPTVGFNSYHLNVDVAANLIFPVVDQKGGAFIFLGCFTYGSFDIVHHSAFCYFFMNGSSLPQNWNFCSIGNYAD